MWGIVIGMALIFGTSLHRYQTRAVRTAKVAVPTRQEQHDKLRDRYGI